jgi:Flp pilus assembly protein TadG
MTPHPRRRRRWRGEEGSATAETALLAPLLLLLALAAAGLGRTATGRIQLDAAARQAARAASLARDPATAATTADTTARAALAGTRLTCTDLRIATDTSHYAPGGTLTVTLRCTTQLADIAMPGLPGNSTLTAQFTSPIDTYRSTPNPP